MPLRAIAMFRCIFHHGAVIDMHGSAHCVIRPSRRNQLLHLACFFFRKVFDGLGHCGDFVPKVLPISAADDVRNGTLCDPKHGGNFPLCFSICVPRGGLYRVGFRHFGRRALSAFRALTAQFSIRMAGIVGTRKQFQVLQAIIRFYAIFMIRRHAWRQSAHEGINHQTVHGAHCLFHTVCHADTGIPASIMPYFAPFMRAPTMANLPKRTHFVEWICWNFPPFFHVRNPHVLRVSHKVCTWKQVWGPACRVYIPIHAGRV